MKLRSLLLVRSIVSAILLIPAITWAENSHWRVDVEVLADQKGILKDVVDVERHQVNAVTMSEKTPYFVEFSLEKNLVDTKIDVMTVLGVLRDGKKLVLGKPKMHLGLNETGVVGVFDVKSKTHLKVRF